MPRSTLARVLVLLLGSALLAPPLLAAEREPAPPPADIDQRTGRILNEAIELMNADDLDGAQGKLGELDLQRLSPYERGRVEQILANIEYSKANYAVSRQHMQAAIDSGGLNAQEIAQVSYQIAQLYMAEENWEEGTRAMEAWIATAAAPNSAAFYLLAAAYYQMEDFDKSLPNAQKAVELSETPQEGWLQLLQALLLQKEDYAAAVEVLRRSINLYPEKKVYWLQLSSVYATLEDYRNALSVLQLANLAGLLEDDGDYRRLAELMMAQDSPVKAAELLSAKLDAGVLKADQKLYELLSNAWIAAREYRSALPPLEQAAGLADDGNLFVRLGEVNMQIEDWPAAAAAFDKALEKGGVRNEGSVHLLLGIAHFNANNFDEAVRWLERAARSESEARNARAYLQLIESRQG